MVIGNSRSPGFGVEPLGKGISECMDTATRPGACFKHRDVMTCLCEFVCSRQAGQPSADDNHPLRRALSFQVAWVKRKTAQRRQRERCRRDRRLLQEVSTSHTYSMGLLKRLVSCHDDPKTSKRAFTSLLIRESTWPPSDLEILCQWTTRLKSLRFLFSR